MKHETITTEIELLDILYGPFYYWENIIFIIFIALILVIIYMIGERERYISKWTDKWGKEKINDNSIFRYSIFTLKSLWLTFKLLFLSFAGWSLGLYPLITIIDLVSNK